MKIRRLLGAILCLCMIAATACASQVDWSQWDLGSTSQQQNPSQVDWSQWDFGSTSQQEYSFEQQNASSGGYISPASFLGGVAPAKRWNERDMEYAEYPGWSASLFSDYLYFLLEFGYHTVSDIQLDDTRIITLTPRDVANAPCVLTLCYTEERLLAASDEGYQPVIAANVPEASAKVLETRLVRAMEYELADGQYSSAWYPRSAAEDQLFATLRESGGKRRYCIETLSDSVLYAVRLRMPDASQLPPNQARFYLQQGAFDLVNLPLCEGAASDGPNADTLYLTGLTPEQFTADASYWVVFPLYETYPMEGLQLRVCTVPAQCMDPGRDPVIALPAEAETP